MNEKTPRLKESHTREIAEIINEQKGVDIVIMDLSEVSTTLNYFIIATGISRTHLRGIAENIQKDLKDRDIYPHHIEGYSDANWILMDYGDIIVHLFDEKSREFYQIERLWGDAREISI